MPDNDQVIPRGIDHLVLAVRDLDEAAATYEALGFTLTPRAQHPFGTANRLVQLQGSFLELLEIDRPQMIGASEVPPQFPQFNRDFVVGGEGLSMLVLEGGDVQATHDEMSRSDLAPRPIFSFERDARQPDGSVEQVGFDLVFVDYPAAMRAGFFTCSQTRPDLFWKDEYQSHANGATGVHIVTMEAGDPGSLSNFLGRFSGCETPSRGSGYVVDTPRGRLEIKPGQALPIFTRYVIKTNDLNAVRHHAGLAKIPFRETSLGLEIAANHMHGVTVGFVQA